MTKWMCDYCSDSVMAEKRPSMQGMQREDAVMGRPASMNNEKLNGPTIWTQQGETDGDWRFHGSTAI
jgi:hypothetical protein